MPIYDKLTEQELIDLLTRSYHEQRKLSMYGGSEQEVAACKLQLYGILKELNSRRESWNNGEKQKREFLFSRRSDR